MVLENSVGLILAVSSSSLIGTNFILKRKGLIRAAASSTPAAYLTCTVNIRLSNYQAIALDIFSDCKGRVYSLMNNGTIDALRLKIINQLKANVRPFYVEQM
ncbi:hypothetical protein V2J09_017078 [Rumex salicifolius]